jgi:hypothetical protein
MIDRSRDFRPENSAILIVVSGAALLIWIYVFARWFL